MPLIYVMAELVILAYLHITNIFMWWNPNIYTGGTCNYSTLLYIVTIMNLYTTCSVIWNCHASVDLQCTMMFSGPFVLISCPKNEITRTPLPLFWSSGAESALRCLHLGLSFFWFAHDSLASVSPWLCRIQQATCPVWGLAWCDCWAGSVELLDHKRCIWFLMLLSWPLHIWYLQLINNILWYIYMYIRTYTRAPL